MQLLTCSKELYNLTILIALYKLFYSFIYSFIHLFHLFIYLWHYQAVEVSENSTINSLKMAKSRLSVAKYHIPGNRVGQ